MFVLHLFVSQPECQARLRRPKPLLVMTRNSSRKAEQLTQRAVPA
jgi:hypothetical protein